MSRAETRSPFVATNTDTPKVMHLLRSFILIVGLALAEVGVSAAGRPNVLMIVSDDLTTTALGAYGNTLCRTPNIDRLAREGVRFSRAYCQYPVCGASRASLMSGLYPEQNGMMGNSYVLGSYRAATPELAEHPSLGGFLRRRGYVSLRVSKIYHMGIPFSIESGDSAGDEPDSWDRVFNIMAAESGSAGEFTLLSPKRPEFGTSFTRIVIPDAEEPAQADALAASQAIAIMRARAGWRGGAAERRQFRPQDPFFLAVGFVRPHVPLVVPQRLMTNYPEGSVVLPAVPRGDLDDVPKPAAAMRNDLRYGMNEAQQKQAIGAYYAAVEFMDEQVGKLLAELDRLKLRENTIVVFISDHGFHLGEHTLWQKTTLFEESLCVPLLISAPGFARTAGSSSEALVELLDLYPTLADLGGVSGELPKNLAGRSLRPLLENPAMEDFRDIAYSVTGNGGRSICSATWRYNRWGTGEEELYDLANDPRQFTNLSGDPKHHVRLAQMRAALERKVASLGVLPRASRAGDKEP